MQHNTIRRTPWRVRRLLFISLAVIGITGLFSGQVLAVDPIDGYDPATDAPSNAVSTHFEGCKLDKDNEGTYDPPNGVFICDTATSWPVPPGGTDSYVNGNLGKEYNELDEVPHRFGTNTDGLTTSNETFRIVIGADNLVSELTDPDTIGYDRVTVLGLNTGLSDSSCVLTIIGDNQFGDFGQGGNALDMAQVVEITQNADTQCVIDSTLRLAIGSRFITGSSNRAFIIGGGSESIPIPSDVQPQVLTKSMSAVEDSLINWLIEKEADPVDFNFGNTCNDEVPNTKDVVVDITFTKGATLFGDLTATTAAATSNPSSRDVTYTCTDVVYGVLEGAGSESIVDTQSFEAVVAAGTAPGTNVEHILLPGTRSLRDELTCILEVEDILNPGTFINVGTLTAEFSLPNSNIAAGDVVNETVEVLDVEEIAGTGYTFSALQSGGVTGAFDGYTPGDTTTGPVTWLSDPQGDSGTVQFTKTVTVERAIDSNGTLSDVASIDLTGTIDVEDTASTTFTTDPLIDLVINKNLGFMVANDTVWVFEVKDSGGNVEANVEITIAGGSNTGSVTVDDLEPDTYTVTETGSNGWVPVGNPLNVTLSLPSCEGELTFTNNPPTDFFAQVEVQKMTDPTGSEDGWTFDLTGAESASVTTTDENFIRFNLDGGVNPGADAGSYSIVEQVQDDWDLQINDIVFSVAGCFDLDQNVDAEGDRSSCDFNVLYERDAGCIFRCTFKNIQRGTIIVEKQTDPADSPQGFNFTGDAVGTLLDNETIEVDNLVPGTYTSTELVPDNWDLTDITCDDGTSTNPSNGDLNTATATFELDPGETVKCTFSNRERGDADVLKTVSGGLPNGEVFYFEIRTGADADNVGDVTAQCTHDPALINGTDPVSGACTFRCNAGDPSCRNVEDVAKLVPGDYQFCEVDVMPGWTSDIKYWTDAFPLPVITSSMFVPNQNDPLVDNSIYCAPFTLDAGVTVNFRVDNEPPPGGDARTIGFWKNWASCTGGGQDPVLDETLANSPITCADTGLRGIWIGDVCISECYQAVSILDKRVIDEGLRGKKLASDACYNAASQLLASELNELAGARTCTDLVNLQSSTQTNLHDKGFEGDRKCITNKKDPIAGYLNTDAGYLDDYNNNEPGSVCN